MQYVNIKNELYGSDEKQVLTIQINTVSVAEARISDTDSDKTINCTRIVIYTFSISQWGPMLYSKGTGTPFR